MTIFIKQKLKITKKKTFFLDKFNTKKKKKKNKNKNNKKKNEKLFKKQRKLIKIINRIS